MLLRHYDDNVKSKNILDLKEKRVRGDLPFEHIARERVKTL